MHLQYRLLSFPPVWSDSCQQPCPRFSLELHNNAAHSGGIWNPQENSSLYDVEVGVVRVRMLKADRDNHRYRNTGLLITGGGCEGDGFNGVMPWCLSTMSPAHILLEHPRLLACLFESIHCLGLAQPQTTLWTRNSVGALRILEWELMPWM